MMCCIFFQMSC